MTTPASDLTAALFQPLDLRTLHLPNRTVMAPMGRLFAQHSVPNPAAPRYYARRAEGGVGLIITEAIGIDHPWSTDHLGITLLHGPAFAGWKAVVDEVHRVGGRIAAQLFHQGMLRGGSVADGTLDTLRPSGVLGSSGPNSFDPAFVARTSQPTAPMTEAQIADAIAAFARSAAMAVAAGFDAIELHGAHGYLIDSFLWGESNLRHDPWGGPPAQRARFAAAVARAVREQMPAGMPLFFRFSQHKSHHYDARLADTPDTLEALLGPISDAGVDVFDASIRRFWQPAFEGSPLNLAGWARKLTGKPTIAVGSVGLSNTASDTFQAKETTLQDNVPALMERFDNGEFDLIAIGRSLLADPDYVHKLRSRDTQPKAFHRDILARME